MTDRYITKKEVLTIAGLSHVTQWRMEKRGEFPQRRQISPGRVGWLESEITAWLESRPVSELPSPKKAKEAA
jgi:prophage regulatory protein